MTTPQPQYAAPAPRPGSGFTFKAADAIVALGGLLIFFFSFAPFISVGDGFGSVTQNSWHSGITVFIAFAGLILVASAFLDSVWKREEPRFGFHRHVIQVGIALFAFFDLIGFAIGDAVPGIGWGAIVELIGSIVAAAGAFLNQYNLLQAPLALPQARPAYPPAGYPQGYQPPAQGAPGVGAPSDPQAPTQAG